VGPLYPKMREVLANGHRGRETGHASRNVYEPQPPTTPYGDFRTKFRPDNGFGFDYESQQTSWFSGLPGLWVQDAACQAGVMPIYDRTQENLCATDAGIILTRRMLLDGVKALREQGVRPTGADAPETFMVRAVSMHMPVGSDWQQTAAGPMTARVGADFGYEL
jgi:phthalate 4,5-dioxygenase oxygenase subunit